MFNRDHPGNMGGMMLKVLIPLSVALVSFASPNYAFGLEPIRRVVGGDVIYQSKVSDPQQIRSIFLAQAAAAYLLSVECGAVPLETRVFKQATAIENGRFLTTVEMGSPIADCESLRLMPTALRKKNSHPSLSRAASIYEIAATQKNLSEPQNVALHLQRESDQRPVLVLSEQQEMGVIRKYEKLIDQRLKERQLIRNPN